MPPKLVIEVVGDTAGLERSFRRATKETQQFGKSITNAGKGAIAASLSFRGLGRSIGLVSAGFLGGAGVVAALKSTIGAAVESQRVLGQTENAVRRTGQSWEQFGKQVQGVALAQAQVSGFDDERLLGTFSALVRSTKDVNEALRLNALAANVARGANIELEQATKIVLRASQGQARGLAVLGVTVAKGAKGFEILRQIQQKFANSAVTFGNTAAGAQDRFRVAIENFQEVLGREALPAITRYLNRGADWLNQTENQQRALRGLRSVVATVKEIVSALTPFVQGAAAAAQKFADAVGGAKEAVQLLAGAVVALKFTGLIAGLATTGATAKGAAGSVGLLSKRLVALRLLGPIAIPVTVGIEVLLHRDQIDSAVTGWLRDRGLGGLTGEQIKADTVAELQKRLAVERRLRPGGLAQKTLEQALRNLLGQKDTGIESARSLFQRAPGFGISGGATAGRLRPAVLKALGLDQLIPQSLQLQEAQARTEAQQRTVFLEKLAVINKKLRGRLAFDDRLALETEKTQILSSLQAMNAAELAARKDHADKVKAAEKKAADDAKRAAEAARKAREKALKVALAGVRRPTLGVAGGPLTLGQVRAAEAANTQAAQFRALGLTATGEKRAPGARTLLRLSDQLIGRAEPGKLEDRVKAIRKVITANFKGMSDEVRRTVRGMLDDIDNQLKDRAGPRDTGFRHASPNKLAALLLPGGSAAERRHLAAGLSQIGRGGSFPGGRSPAFAMAGAGGGITIHGGVHLHGVQNVRELEDNLARRASQRARVRRGAS